MDLLMNWKAIPGGPRYEASETGLIRNRGTGKVLRQRDKIKKRQRWAHLHAHEGLEAAA
jgi:hypothetical protein